MSSSCPSSVIHDATQAISSLRKLKGEGIGYVCNQLVPPLPSWEANVLGKIRVPFPMFLFLSKNLHGCWSRRILKALRNRNASLVVILRESSQVVALYPFLSL